jgi:5-methylcytosine-specific restriction endonuclease McrA
MSECAHQEIKLILRPDTPHYAEKRCGQCNKFLGWQGAPNPEGLRKQSSKYTLQQIMQHKYYNEEPFCFFCGRIKNQLGKNETLTIDHIIPIREDGQGDTLSNLQILCDPCHKLRHWAELYMNKHFVKEDSK